MTPRSCSTIRVFCGDPRARASVLVFRTAERSDACFAEGLSSPLRLKVVCCAELPIGPRRAHSPTTSPSSRKVARSHATIRAGLEQRGRFRAMHAAGNGKPLDNGTLLPAAPRKELVERRRPSGTLAMLAQKRENAKKRKFYSSNNHGSSCSSPCDWPSGGVRQTSADVVGRSVICPFTRVRAHDV